MEPVSHTIMSETNGDAPSFEDDIFNAEDADIILDCPYRPDPGATASDEFKRHTFKAHRAILAAHSTFFKDMVETAGTDSKVDTTPAIRMEEDSGIVSILLSAAYNKPDVQSRLLLTSKDWEVSLLVWEAANKYGFHLLRAYVASLIILNATTVDKHGALKLYTRASVFNDKALAAHFLHRASTIPPHMLPLEILRQIPASALLELMQQHRQMGREALDALVTAMTAVRTDFGSRTVACTHVPPIQDRVNLFKAQFFT